MNQLILGFKREYWEHKKLMVIMPMLVTALFCIVAMAATWSEEYRINGQSLELHSKSLNATGQDKTDQQVTKADEKAFIAEGLKVGSADQTSEKFWFSGVYLAAAWLASIFYALSSLYNDRRDKSILYWKTMPIPELQIVLIKLLFAIVGFSAVAVAISWLAGAVLMSYAQWVFPSEILADDPASMGFSKLVVWPILAIITGLFWCAPIYALVLYVSAKVSKMPILWLIIPVIVIRVLEGVLFHTQHIYGFLDAHSPFTLLARFSEMQSGREFLTTYWVDSFASMVLGLVVAAFFVWAAAWCRENNFDI